MGLLTFSIKVMSPNNALHSDALALLVPPVSADAMCSWRRKRRGVCSIHERQPSQLEVPHTRPLTNVLSRRLQK